MRALRKGAQAKAGGSNTLLSLPLRHHASWPGGESGPQTGPFSVVCTKVFTVCWPQPAVKPRPRVAFLVGQGKGTEVKSLFVNTLDNKEAEKYCLRYYEGRPGLPKLSVFLTVCSSSYFVFLAKTGFKS